MLDKVRYDIYVNARRSWGLGDSPSRKARDSIDCMDDLKVGEQVIIICGARVKESSPEIVSLYSKYKNKSLALYQKDRKGASTPRKFKHRWNKVVSDTPMKRLRTNHHLVIERIS